MCVIRYLLTFILVLPLYAEDSISNYLKFLKANQEVLGKNGNFREGEIEVVTDPLKIRDIEKLQKARCLKQGMSEAEAVRASKIGLIS